MPPVWNENCSRPISEPPGDLQVQLHRPEVINVHSERLRKRAEQVEHFAGHAAHHHVIGQALQLRHLDNTNRPQRHEWGRDHRCLLANVEWCREILHGVQLRILSVSQTFITAAGCWTTCSMLVKPTFINLLPWILTTNCWSGDCKLSDGLFHYSGMFDFPITRWWTPLMSFATKQDK